jgi:hypothetical protein
MRIRLSIHIKMRGLAPQRPRSTLPPDFPSGGIFVTGRMFAEILDKSTMCALKVRQHKFGFSHDGPRANSFYISGLLQKARP